MGNCISAQIAATILLLATAHTIALPRFGTPAEAMQSAYRTAHQIQQIAFRPVATQPPTPAFHWLPLAGITPATKLGTTQMEHRFQHQRQLIPQPTRTPLTTATPKTMLKMQ